MKNRITYLINILKVFLLFITLFITITTISSVSYSIAYKLYGIFRIFDPDNSFLLITFHHILLAIAALIIILLISKVLKIELKDFGFNKNGFCFSMKKILLFCGIWTIIQFAGSVYLIKTTSTPVNFPFPLSVKNFLGYFLFEILLTGTSEEILFRALVIPLMLYNLEFIKSEKKSNIFAVIAATFIFMLAHINFNLNPFEITYINPLQQITSLITGIFFGYLFIKTKSILGPMIAHNAINGVITIIGLIMFFVFGY